jgi:hypothetical protein
MATRQADTRCVLWYRDKHLQALQIRRVSSMDDNGADTFSPDRKKTSVRVTTLHCVSLPVDLIVYRSFMIVWTRVCYDGKDSARVCAQCAC